MNEDSKKILVITYYWPPSGGAGVQRWVKLTKYLSRLNTDIFILTVDKKYASYTQFDPTLLGEVDSAINIRKTKSLEAANLSAKILGKKSFPKPGFNFSNRSGLLTKLLIFIRTNFFIPDPRVGWVPFAYYRAKKIINKENIKYIITTSPPHSTQIIGLKLKKKFPSLTWISDLRDPWTDIYFFEELQHTRYSRNRNKYYETKVLEQSDWVITVSPSLKDLFVNKSTKLNSDKIKVIPNGFDHEDFINKRKSIESSKFIITYTGNMAENYPVRNFFKVIEGMVLAKNLKMEIRMVGLFPRSLKELIEKSKTLDDCVVFYSPVAHQTAIDYMVSSNLNLLVIPNANHNKGILTGKLFEYLASGNPILCLGPEDGDAARIIEKCEMGITVDPSDRLKIENFLLACYVAWEDHNSHQVGNAEIKEYSREEQAIKIRAVL